jgi:hypothetical protein
MPISNATNDAQEQRDYAPHGMLRRDPATQRRLDKILGRPVAVEDQSAATTMLPPDMLHEMGKVVEQNRTLVNGVPAIQEENQKIKAEMGSLKAELGGIKDALAQIAQALGMAKMSQKSVQESEAPRPAPRKGKDLPPPEK